jgi:hypothetical protein
MYFLIILTFMLKMAVYTQHMLWLNKQLRLLSGVLEHHFHIGAHQHFTTSLKTELAVFSKMFVPIDNVNHVPELRRLQCESHH